MNPTPTIGQILDLIKTFNSQSSDDNSLILPIKLDLNQDDPIKAFTLFELTTGTPVAMDVATTQWIRSMKQATQAPLSEEPMSPMSMLISEAEVLAGLVNNLVASSSPSLISSSQTNQVDAPSPTNQVDAPTPTNQNTASSPTRVATPVQTNQNTASSPTRVATPTNEDVDSGSTNQSDERSQTPVATPSNRVTTITRLSEEFVDSDEDTEEVSTSQGQQPFHYYAENFQLLNPIQGVPSTPRSLLPYQNNQSSLAIRTGRSPQRALSILDVRPGPSTLTIAGRQLAAAGTKWKKLADLLRIDENQLVAKYKLHALHPGISSVFDALAKRTFLDNHGTSQIRSLPTGVNGNIADFDVATECRFSHSEQGAQLAEHFGYELACSLESISFLEKKKDIISNVSIFFFISSF
jgi:hypothetical protein